MQLAIQGQSRVEPFPKGKAECPLCGSEVIAKCGSIMSWHWSHKANDCDSWSEPESKWHIDWKNQFPKDWQEVIIGDHRADVQTKTKVIEFQASSISAEQIEAREAHYKDMVWVLKGEDFWDNFDKRKQDGYYSFRWKNPRKSWWIAKSPIVIDFGGVLDLFLIKRLHNNIPCGGWGEDLSGKEFFELCGVSLDDLLSQSSKFGVMSKMAIAGEYERGVFLKQDYTEAHRWWNLAYPPRQEINV
jgi:competence protein CoiA